MEILIKYDELYFSLFILLFPLSLFLSHIFYTDNINLLIQFTIHHVSRKKNLKSEILTNDFLTKLNKLKRKENTQNYIGRISYPDTVSNFYLKIS